MCKKVLGSKSLGIILLAAGLALSLAACGSEDTGTKPLGDGTSGSPFQISEQDHLKYMEKNVSKFTNTTYFELVNNITVSGSLAPIGTSSRPFKGNFDGLGHTISNLSIYLPASENVGLFGWIEGGTVQNLNVALAAGGVTGLAYVGGITGGIDGAGAEIVNCSVTGNVTGSGSVPGAISEDVGGVGGIAGGVSDSAVISSCSFAGSVSSDIGDAIGGIAGYVHEGYIDKSYATGSVEGYDSVGGVVGYVYDSYIIDCYATGDITGNNSVGGVAGMIISRLPRVSPDPASGVYNSYATGSVEGYDSVGGVAGIVENDGASSAVLNCAALNSAVKRISGDGAKLGFVAGYDGGLNSILNNWAHDGIPSLPSEAHGVMGAVITKLQAKDQNYYDYTAATSLLDWDFTVSGAWKWSPSPATYPLPVLKWQTTAPINLTGHPLM